MWSIEEISAYLCKKCAFVYNLQVLCLYEAFILRLLFKWTMNQLIRKKCYKGAFKSKHEHIYSFNQRWIRNWNSLECKHWAMLHGRWQICVQNVCGPLKNVIRANKGYERISLKRPGTGFVCWDCLTPKRKLPRKHTRPYMVLKSHRSWWLKNKIQYP